MLKTQKGYQRLSMIQNFETELQITERRSSKNRAETMADVRNLATKHFFKITFTKFYDDCLNHSRDIN